MRIHEKFVRAATLSLLLLPAVPAVAAAQVGGELFYTRFKHAPGEANVKSADFRWDGAEFSLSNRRDILEVGGADGIAFAPDGDLLVAGQTPVIYKFDPDHPRRIETAATAGVASFHIYVDPSETKLWTGGQPGDLVSVPLAPFGDGTAHPLSGDDTLITQVVFDPAGRSFYSASSPTGDGHFGLIDLTTFTTTRLMSIRGAHGMAFDEFSNTLFVYGGTHVLQIDTDARAIVADLDLSSSPGMQTGSHDTFDQGAVTGQGQFVVAANNGNVYLIDYSASSRVDDVSTKVAYAFLDPFLDDIAPLIGPGSRPVKNAPDGGKVTGGGTVELPGGMANFGFNARGNPQAARGHLSYQDHVTGMHVRSLSLHSVYVNTTRATFAGDCLKDGMPCTFRVVVDDLGEPGREDRFQLTVDGVPLVDDVLRSGNIQIH